MCRSQAILRMPVDQIEVVLIGHDGTRSDAMLFVPPTDAIEQMLDARGNRFLPTIMGGKVQLVARDAIAALGVQSVIAMHQDGDLPVEVQAVAVHLRSGTVLEGELRWTATIGQARTADHLNGPSETLELHATNLTFHIAKGHIARVEETCPPNPRGDR